MTLALREALGNNRYLAYQFIIVFLTLTLILMTIDTEGQRVRIVLAISYTFSIMFLIAFFADDGLFDLMIYDLGKITGENSKYDKKKHKEIFKKLRKGKEK